MSRKEQIQLFETKKVRTVWDDEKEEWFFSVVDVVEVLTDSANPTDYLKKMRKREPELGVYIGTNCPQVTMTTSTGKKRKTLAATIEQLFRIIQSIPSPKAEPFKQMTAQVAAERPNQMKNPERSIGQAVSDYKRLWYSDAWKTSHQIHRDTPKYLLVIIVIILPLILFITLCISMLTSPSRIVLRWWPNRQNDWFSTITINVK